MCLLSVKRTWKLLRRPLENSFSGEKQKSSRDRVIASVLVLAYGEGLLGLGLLRMYI